MSQLVDQDVFETLRWFLRQIRVQADVARGCIAASPLGLHPLDEYGRQLSTFTVDRLDPQWDIRPVKPNVLQWRSDFPSTENS